MPHSALTTRNVQGVDHRTVGSEGEYADIPDALSALLVDYPAGLTTPVFIEVRGSFLSGGIDVVKAIGPTASNPLHIYSPHPVIDVLPFEPRSFAMDVQFGDEDDDTPEPYFIKILASHVRLYGFELFGATEAIVVEGTDSFNPVDDVHVYNTLIHQVHTGIKAVDATGLRVYNTVISECHGFGLDLVRALTSRIDHVSCLVRTTDDTLVPSFGACLWLRDCDVELRNNLFIAHRSQLKTACIAVEDTTLDSNFNQLYAVGEADTGATTDNDGVDYTAHPNMASWRAVNGQDLLSENTRPRYEGEVFHLQVKDIDDDPIDPYTTILVGEWGFDRNMLRGWQAFFVFSNSSPNEVGETNIFIEENKESEVKLRKGLDISVGDIFEVRRTAAFGDPTPVPVDFDPKRIPAEGEDLLNPTNGSGGTKVGWYLSDIPVDIFGAARYYPNTSPGAIERSLQVNNPDAPAVSGHRRILELLSGLSTLTFDRIVMGDDGDSALGTRVPRSPDDTEADLASNITPTPIVREVDVEVVKIDGIVDTNRIRYRLRIRPDGRYQGDLAESPSPTLITEIGLGTEDGVIGFKRNVPQIVADVVSQVVPVIEFSLHIG